MKSNKLFSACLFVILCLIFLAGCVSEKNNESVNQPVPAAENSATDAQSQIKAKIEKNLNDLAAQLKVKKIEQKEIYGILKNFVELNPEILGSAFAFAPKDENGKTVKSSPYIYRIDGKIAEKDLINFYDYTSDKQKWYVEPVKAGKPMWSEPYYDDGGANVLMTTYSIPIYDSANDNLLVGVLTADLLIQKK